MQVSPEEVAAWVAEGEGRRLEFKRGLPRGERVARTLCAFANTNGGILLVGVSDARRVLGVADPRGVIDELRSVAAELLAPAVVVVSRSVEVAGEAVVCCSVPLSPERPHAVRHADGSTEIVVRVGASNRVAEGATLRAIAPQRTRNGPDELERRILAWLARPPAGPRSTISVFARAHNVGKQRAKRAFLRLERNGHIVGHGPGARREYGLGNRG